MEKRAPAGESHLALATFHKIIVRRLETVPLHQRLKLFYDNNINLFRADENRGLLKVFRV